MSDSGQGPGWWQASDGKWYPPEDHPDFQAGATQPMAAAEPPATAAMPPVPPSTPPPAAMPPPGAAVPPPGAPGGGSGNAKWIVIGVLVVAAIAIAAFLLTRGDDKKNVSTSSSPSSSSSSKSSSSSSTKSSSSSTKSSSSSSKSSSSSSSSGVSSSQIQSRLLKASDIDPSFSDETFTPDNTTPSPCGQPNPSADFPPVIDVGSEASNSGGDLFFEEEVTTYKDAATGAKAFQAGKDGLNCTQGTAGSSGEPVTISPPKDVSSDFNVPEAIEVDVSGSGIQGQLIAIHSGDTVVVFSFVGSTSADTTAISSPQDLVKKGLAKLSS